MPLLPAFQPARGDPARRDGGGLGRAAHGGQALIVLVNLLHLISADEARILIAEAAQALPPAGCLPIYGPFLREGRATSDGDARFHASLKAQDPDLGYKDVAEVRRWLEAQGLALIRTRRDARQQPLSRGRRPA